MEQKHVVVTGGGRGIGASVAEKFHDLNARVTIVGRSEEPLKSLSESRKNMSYAVADVTDGESTTRAFKQAVNRYGPVSILVNNAGAAKSAPFDRTSTELWDSMLAVNLTGMFNCQRQVLALSLIHI